MSTTTRPAPPHLWRRAAVTATATAAVAAASATTVAVLVDHAQIDMSVHGSTEAGPALAASAR